MINWRSVFVALAASTTALAVGAYGQAVCNIAGANAVLVRAEGNTEQVADTTVTCTVPPGNAAVAPGQTVNLSVFLSPAVAITSAVLGSGSSALSETQAGVTAGFAAGGGPPAVYGVVSNSSVVFSGIPLPAIAVGGSTTLTITNIRIAASAITTGSGVPTAVSETVFVTGGSGVTSSVIAPAVVAYVSNGLTGIKSRSAKSNPICNDIVAKSGGVATPNWSVTFAEGFSNAFKVQGTVAGNAVLGSQFANHTETGFGVTANGGNQAASGTRIKLVINNIPAGVKVYVPLTASNLGGTVTLTASETGAFSAVAASTDSTAAAGTAALTVSNGSATAIYETTAASTGLGATYTVPVYLYARAGTVPLPAGAITTTVSFAPIGSAPTIPSFISGASTATVNGGRFTACTTTMIFPFVTNQSGFDTGIAISNTSSDDLPLSTAVRQSGTCSLAFWGDTAPSADFTTPLVQSGTSYTTVLSQIAPGFQGYVTANCNFLWAHGFAYVAYDLTQGAGAAMGYLASVISSDRTSPIQTISSSSVLTGGVLTEVDVTSSNSAVSSFSPESWGH